jgi:hypothetical protein
MTNVAPASVSGASGDVSPTGVSGSATNSKMRKRTKTGCLTCRKRRIKCGEERPTCANCIKSKRQCEGYNQRVIFKPPIGDWPNHPGVVSTIQYHTSMLPGTRNQSYRGPEPAAAMQENMLGSIQPRMHGSYDFSHIDPSSAPGPSDPQQGFTEGNPNYPHEQAYQQPLPSPLHQQPLQSPNHQVHNHTPTASYFPPPPTMHTSPQTQFRHDSHSTYQAPLQYTQSASYPPVSVPYNHESNLKAAVPQPPPIDLIASKPKVLIGIIPVYPLEATNTPITQKHRQGCKDMRVTRKPLCTLYKDLRQTSARLEILTTQQFLTLTSVMQVILLFRCLFMI